jgi:hypothetical protein
MINPDTGKPWAQHEAFEYEARRETGPRGGQGRNYDGTWAAADGKGCPLCGAIRNGGHGGGCPNTEQYDEHGNVIRWTTRLKLTAGKQRRGK